MATDIDYALMAGASQHKTGVRPLFTRRQACSVASDPTKWNGGRLELIKAENSALVERRRIAMLGGIRV